MSDGLAIGVGNVVRMTHFTAHSPALQVGYKAPKDRVFVLLLLGEEDRKTILGKTTETLDPEKALARLGYFRKKLDFRVLFSGQALEEADRYGLKRDFLEDRFDSAFDIEPQKTLSKKPGQAGYFIVNWSDLPPIRGLKPGLPFQLAKFSKGGKKRR